MEKMLKFRKMRKIIKYEKGVTFEKCQNINCDQNKEGIFKNHEVYNK